MRGESGTTRDRLLLALMLAYGTASLVHFLHNAMFLDAYPNMPAWLSPLGVMASWLAVAAVGVAGHVLYRRGARLSGLLVTAIFAALGFAGLDHYAIAPVDAHSRAMNATIAAEVISAGVLVVYVGWLAATSRGLERRGESPSKRTRGWLPR